MSFILLDGEGFNDQIRPQAKHGHEYKCGTENQLTKETGQWTRGSDIPDQASETILTKQSS